MKRTITSFALTSLLTVTMQAENPDKITRFINSHRHTDGKTMPAPDKAKELTVKDAIRKAALSNAIYRPGKMEIYFYERKWIKDSDITFKYDSRGNVVEETEEVPKGDSFTRIVYEYNSDNREIFSLTSFSEDNLDYVDMDKKVHAYDPVVGDFETLREDYKFEYDEWLCINGQKHEVERNSDGNVVKVTRSVYLKNEGRYDPIMTMSVKYDENGLASEISSDVLVVNKDGGFEWVRAYDLTDIEWENTDGQLLWNVSDYMTYYFEGNNRIKSAKMVEEGYPFVINSEYAPNGDYVATLTSDKGEKSYYKNTVIDENGSFVYENIGIDFVDKIEFMFDEKENLLSEIHEYTLFNENQEIEKYKKSGQKYEYIYNELGEQESLIAYNYDMDADKFVPNMKIVSLDYSDVSSGITDVEIDYESDFDVYDLSGNKVKTTSDKSDLYRLQKGVYVVRQGSAAEKIIR